MGNKVPPHNQMTKIKLIKAKTEDELLILMNQENAFASQPIQKIDGNWVCFIYQKDFPNEFQNKKELIEKPSEAQIRTLKKMKKYKEGITKQEAWQIINEASKRGKKNE